jgi:hypothetical protein
MEGWWGKRDLYEGRDSAPFVCNRGHRARPRVAVSCFYRGKYKEKASKIPALGRTMRGSRGTGTQRVREVISAILLQPYCVSARVFF